jgi:hypothetical protein
MNTNKNENGNSEIPEVEDLVIDDGDDAETVKAKASKYKEQVDNKNAFLFARTKRAEGFELEGDKWVKPNKADEGKPRAEASKINLTQTDVFTLIKNDIAEEDIEDVAEYASFRKISIAEALKSSVVKTMLAEKVEQRKVANGTHTGSSKRQSGNTSNDTILSNSKKGILPDSDEDISRLALLRKAKK